MTQAPPTVAIVERINAFAQRSLQPLGDPGVSVVVVNHTGIISCRAFGQTSNGTPVTCDTPFAIASLTKAFTALVALRLVQEHRIDLDAPVAHYLPWFSMADAAATKITVRDLLEQRSGIDTATGLAWALHDGRPYDTGEQRVYALQTAHLAATPGTRFIYSNVNYDILGLIIGVAGGRRSRLLDSFASDLERYVYAPLGIGRIRTSCNALPRGYARILSVPVVAGPESVFCADMPAAGLVMSARQYGRFLAAQLDAGRSWSKAILRAPYWKLMHTSPDDSPYALGWYDTRYTDGTQEVHHDGWAPTSHSFVAFYPARDIGAARFANANEVPDGGREAVGEIALERILRGKEPPAFPIVPPDLYLRLGLAALLITTVATMFRKRSIAQAFAGAVVQVSVCAALLWYVLPLWGYSPIIGFAFSPDLTVLVVCLCAALVTSALVGVARVQRRRSIP